ncbi:unnamed protein product [Leuciscus chuanchicus]
MILQEVQVSLPKFKTEEKYQMKSLLISMGMEDVFDNKVNLSGMSSKNDLVVSKVIHKAFVEVDEEGTEAAAATAIITIAVSTPLLDYNSRRHSKQQKGWISLEDGLFRARHSRGNFKL